jgi:nucleotide-binding universal stress UspA family protein
MTTSLAQPLRRILCGTDFSPCAMLALDWAGELAEREGAELHVVHAWPIPEMWSPAGSFVAIGALADGIEEGIRRQLDELRATRRIAGTHAVCGPSDVSITAKADEIGADLLVVGTQGRSGLAHVLLGSVAERVLRTARVPVVTVPQAWAEREPAGPLINRVMIAADLDGDTELAVGEALAFASRLGAQVDLLHVLELAPYLVRHPTICDELEHAARVGLSELARRHIHSASSAHVEVRLGRAAETIIERASEREVDLLVLPTHGRTGVTRLMLGSVAERVARLARRPVLSLRAATARPLEPSHGEG